MSIANQTLVHRSLILSARQTRPQLALPVKAARSRDFASEDVHVLLARPVVWPTGRLTSGPTGYRPTGHRADWLSGRLTIGPTDYRAD